MKDENKNEEGGKKKDEPTSTPIIPKNEEQVTVKKSDLEAFIKRLDDMDELNKKLLAIADKGRLAHQAEKDAEGKILIRTVKISRFGKEGPIILSWPALLSNESYVTKGRAVANQTIELVLEKENADGTFDTETKKMDILDFFRHKTANIVAEVISRKKNEKTETEELEVELPGGRMLNIGLPFVN